MKDPVDVFWGFWHLKAYIFGVFRPPKIHLHKTHLDSIIFKKKNNTSILNAFLHTIMNINGMETTRIINLKPEHV